MNWSSRNLTENGSVWNESYYGLYKNESNNTDYYISGFGDATENNYESPHDFTVENVEFISVESLSYLRTFIFYFNIVVCVLGIVGNLINIVVLTRKSMETSTNILLTGLAVADLMVLCSHLSQLASTPVSTMWELVLVWSISSEWQKGSQLVSVWLTLVVSIWRLMAVCYPAPTERWRSTTRAKIAVVAVFVTCTLIIIMRGSLLIFIDCFVYEEKVHYVERVTYLLNYFTTVGIHHLLSVLPCVPVTILSLCLVKAVCKKEKARKRLGLTRNSQETRGTKTTHLLLIVLLLFILTNVPIRVCLFVLYITLNSRNYILRQLLNLILRPLVLINSSANFAIYVAMSTDFRGTLLSLWKRTQRS